jgi:hypothetical protein
MPYALVIIGLLMIITGINNTYSQFGSQLQNDFSGSKSFIVWILAIGSVGALGYIKDLRTFSHYFMALILISMVLANKGVFQNLQAQVAAGPATPQANPTGQTALTSSSSPADVQSAITSNQQGVGGAANPPASSGQAKFNGWMNYLLGLGTSSGASQ